MKTPICPFLKKACIEHQCMMYTHVTMTDPQTGLSKDEYTCCIPLSVMMHIESARQTKGVQASVESMRNEVVKRQDELNSAVLEKRNVPLKEIEYPDGPYGPAHERRLGSSVER
jgi:hypothetical protein